MARRAFTMIELLVVLAIIAVIIGLIVPAVLRVRAAACATQCRNSMKQIGIALHANESSNGTLPAGISRRATNMRYATWMTRILPQMDNTALWQNIEAAFRTEPLFMRPAHAQYLAMRLDIYLCAAEIRVETGSWKDHTVAFTNYLGCEGFDQYTHDGMLFLDSAVRFSDVSDGTSNTLLVGERPTSAVKDQFGWWYAGIGQDRDGSLDSVLGAREEPVEFTLGACSATSNRFQKGNAKNHCEILHFWSYHPGGAHFLFCDGSVRFVTYSFDSILPALATRADNEAVSLSD